MNDEDTVRPGTEITLGQLEEELRRVKARRRVFRMLGWVIALLLVMCALLILTSGLFLPVLRIGGDAMTPTLQAGDMVLAHKGTDVSEGELAAFFITTAFWSSVLSAWADGGSNWMRPEMFWSTGWRSRSRIWNRKRWDHATSHCHLPCLAILCSSWEIIGRCLWTRATPLLAVSARSSWWGKCFSASGR